MPAYVIRFQAADPRVEQPAASVEADERRFVELADGTVVEFLRDGEVVFTAPLRELRCWYRSDAFESAS